MEEKEELENTCFSVFPTSCCQKYFLCTFFGGDILDSRNGNNLKLKVKSEYSLSMGLMLINHSNLYIHSIITLLCDINVIYHITVKFQI